MAIQARLYSDGLAFPFIDDDVVARNPSQDLMDFYLFNLQQQQQQQQYQNYSIHPESIAAHLHRENQEIEKYIRLQNERLRIAIEAERKQQITAILKKYESETGQVLRQKEEEIKGARMRRLELEDLLRRIDTERQKWEMVATKREAMVMNLNKTIEQQVNRKREVVEDDQASCCNGNNDYDDDKKMICRSCFKEESCVVMLPCRHLCLCKSCDVFLHSCPVCSMPKKATIQVSLSHNHL